MSAPLDAVSPAQDSKARHDGLCRKTASAAGVDPDAVIGFLDDVEQAGLDLHGFMLFRDGAVAAEGWRWPYAAHRPRNLHSVAKSFTASAIGLAVQEGLLRLDAPVIGFFPEFAEEARQPGLEAMTVEHLLTMSVGHESETSGAVWRGIKTSWVREFFKIPLAYAPGERFVYTSAASYMLSAILTRLTGQTMHDYLKPRLFEPLGIAGEAWDVGPDGVNPGGNGLVATTADLLKLGILHLQDGAWQGRQVLPPDWVRAATRAQGPSAGYGYQWWVYDDATYAAIGKFVQMVRVYPEHGAVLAVIGAMKGSSRLVPHMNAHFPAAFGVSSPDAAKDERLAARLAAWQHEEAAAPWKSPFQAAGLPAQPPRRLRFTAADNAQGITGIELDLSAEGCRFTLTDADGRHAIMAGWDRWIEGVTDMPGRDLHHGYHIPDCVVVARAAWLDERRLHMTWILPETAFRDTVLCEIDGDTLRYTRTVNINSGALGYDTVVARADHAA
ncbi:serine hydrolase domain-containing protein [Achromobacter insuavis]|uniref:serine hydrolase domain-containing protein n=1 Tax=Achromobacter insuavis TaxID=1287735 RepID=UPI001F13D4FF|nr:serine hydrolase [Achromobacter insuavis]